MTEIKRKNELKPQRPKSDQPELEARKMLIGELFQDYNKSRVQVYKMNFIRGIFFGFGSVLGGTILVALSVWILSFIGQYLPFFSDFFKAVSEVLNG